MDLVEEARQRRAKAEDAAQPGEIQTVGG
jgi:hypothetical protein